MTMHPHHGDRYQSINSLLTELSQLSYEFQDKASLLCEKLDSEAKSIAPVLMRRLGAYDMDSPTVFFRTEAFEFLILYHEQFSRHIRNLCSEFHLTRMKFLYFAELADTIEAKEAEEEAKREAKAAKDRARRAAKKAVNGAGPVV